VKNMQRNEIMQRIIDLETEMFMSVNAEEAVPTLRDNPQIERIVDIEEKWMNELAFKYPHAVKRERANAELFRKYALCELQTWSPAAVNSYFEDIKKAMEEGRNLAEERYDNLYQNIGKGRLRDVEDSLK